MKSREQFYMDDKELDKLKAELIRIQAQLKSYMSARFLQDGVAEKIMLLEKREQEIIEKINTDEHEKKRQTRH
ncbi:MAG: hypothetical protein EP298_07480 [Gammaproteobacteria bacterium]|nr:MAG: hypothetical protein EP298_07480 [Gammaproteobacteria bacterium]UTW42652.1 hypothetical protein KFE69_00445 [bacterium SCSIO 12844]